LRDGNVPVERADCAQLEMLVNSYADAYRMQIHRINGTSDAVANPDQLQADLGAGEKLEAGKRLI
jgi:hypothetical protein